MDVKYCDIHVSQFAINNETFPYSDELPVQKPQNNATVDRDNSDADEVH
jgi:hypothetical protein